MNEASHPSILPRKPERANGRRRYEALVDAAERLLVREGPAALSIRQLALEAGVPMASVYHFFPGPAAVSVGLAERYMAGFVEVLGQPFDPDGSPTWQEIVATLIGRGVTYYRDHPYAQRLILGSDHSWHIRSADLANNRLFAGFIADLLRDSFPGVAPDELLAAVLVGISVNDAVLTLSIFETGSITPSYEREAVTAVCGYLLLRFGAGHQESLTSR